MPRNYFEEFKKKSTNKRGKSRNRRLESQGFQFPTKMAGLLTFASAVALSYLWLCSSSESLANQIKKEEHQLKQLRIKVAQEEARWTDMTGLRNLEKALAKHQLPSPTNRAIPPPGPSSR